MDKNLISMQSVAYAQHLRDKLEVTQDCFPQFTKTIATLIAYSRNRCG